MKIRKKQAKEIKSNTIRCMPYLLKNGYIFGKLTDIFKHDECSVVNPLTFNVG
jgi:hypothetical protein